MRAIQFGETAHKRMHHPPRSAAVGQTKAQLSHPVLRQKRAKGGRRERGEGLGRLDFILGYVTLSALQLTADGKRSL